jgi:hypothetical protein
MSSSQIDFDSSRSENRVCIQNGVDEDIDTLTEYIEGQRRIFKVSVQGTDSWMRRGIQVWEQLLYVYRISNSSEDLMRMHLTRLCQDIAARQVLSDITSSSLRNQLSDLTAHLMPQLGYLIRLPANEEGEIQAPADWDLRVSPD